MNKISPEQAIQAVHLIYGASTKTALPKEGHDRCQQAAQALLAFIEQNTPNEKAPQDEKKA